MLQEDEELRILDRKEVLALSKVRVCRSFSSTSTSGESRGTMTPSTGTPSYCMDEAYIGHVQARTWAGQVI